MNKKKPTILARVLVAILVFTIVLGLVVLFAPPEERKEVTDSYWTTLHPALCILWQTIITPDPVNVFLVLLFGVVGIGMTVVSLWSLHKGRETKKERIRVIPMLSRIDQGECGKTCIVVPASQMRNAATLTLHLHDYGEIIIAGERRAVVKITEVLEALGFEVEIEKKRLYPN